MRLKGLRRGWLVGGLAALAVTGTGVGVAVASIPNTSGVFTGCYGTKSDTVTLPSPVRVLDTRNGTGGSTGAFTGAITVPVGAAVPAGATAVLGTLTATGEQGVGYFTAWASGTRPTASSLNYTPNVDVANSVQVTLSATNTFQLYSLRTSQAVFDVTAYVKNVPGAVRVIDPSAGETCAAGETETTWNQAGQVGPQGPQGATGATGNTGPQGPIGNTGPQGPIGNTGPQGPIGNTGPAGSPATSNVTGTVIVSGPAGSTGIDYAAPSGPTPGVGNGGSSAGIEGTAPDVAITLNHLSVRSSIDVPTGGSIIFDLIVNGSTPLGNPVSCTITAGNNSCTSDTAVTINPGDIYYFYVPTNGGSSSALNADVSYGYQSVG